MNFVIVGTDHQAQLSDCGLEALVSALLDRSHSEPLSAIAEEWNTEAGESICQILSEERSLDWNSLDEMTVEEQTAAGIFESKAHDENSPVPIGFHPMK